MDFELNFGWPEWLLVNGALVAIYYVWLLVVVVTCQITAMSYISSPRWKAFIYALPLPFSVGLFVVDEPINATNVLGLLLLLVYIHLIRLFYNKWGWNIILSIIISVIVYIVAGSIGHSLLPDTPSTFLVSLVITAAVCLVIMQLQPFRDEPGHKTTLPVYVKLPMIIIVVSILVGMKNSLGGFMTTFPMVGVLGAYESRYSLWTMSRQFPRLILCILVLIVVTRFVERVFSLPFALLLGWCVALPLLWKISVKDKCTLNSKHLANAHKSKKTR